MAKAKQTKLLLSVFALDIDHFKEINDSHGHDIGDEVLKEFAKRVKGAIRKNDFLARIGGDEFVILIPELTEKKKVIEIADRIQQCLRDEWIIANEKMKITSSIGISFYNQVDLEEKILFKNADLALYEAKKKGRNNYQIYNKQETSLL
jgi:diguanylate cyclase (GGDEF)-like protein